MITVVGLGVQAGDLTEAGKRAIVEGAKSGVVLCRTANTASYENLRLLEVAHTCLDYVYEKSRNFNTLTENLAKEVLAAGEKVVYCVDGAAAEDNSVKKLRKKLRGKIQIVGGVSKVSALIERAGLDGCAYTALSAYELAERAQEGLTLPLVVYDIDDKGFAGDCKLLLADLFGDETPVRFLSGSGCKKIPLYELDRQALYDYTTAIVIDKTGLLDKKRFSVYDLKEIIALLRKPDGCPWDRVQTPESIKMNVIEEAYELVDAIDLADDEKILEETGDLLMQVVFHTIMKEERGAFTWTDMTSAVCDKLIFRHTHVFGKDRASDESGALNVWEKNKMKEKGQETFAQSVNDVPKAFPAALRAQKVGKRASKAGLDFANTKEVVEQLQRELAEFFEAAAQGDEVALEKEMGDVLFAAVSLARKAGVDAEKALKESVDRFAARFTLAEGYALQEGKEVTSLTAEEWDGYYRKAKTALKGGR
ncbi:MAG: nucleoside triphosphate pyrophosphohydrolase [Clostridia bacterium]|nr:nucleoside triphosphate pyrophosphohydrolase [Clostridia bacterium]